MSDLRLVAVTPERRHLVLEDDESNQFRLPIDERLATALRPASTTPAKPGQLEIALESQLSPREIQTRIRAGRGVDEVAAAAGVPADRIERYAAPVLAEREHVMEQARLAPARRASGGTAPRLGDLVDLRLADQRVAPDSVHWDAWRDDDRWTVHLAYLGGSRERVARWTFDPRGRVLSAANDEARWLVDEDPAERADDGSPARMRRLASVPVETASDDAAAVPATDEVYDREADEASVGAAPARRGSESPRSHRRPPVPSWDDIMFGARRHD